MENIKTIHCPHCRQEIDVNQVLVHQIQEDFHSKYNQKLLDVKNQYKEKYLDLKQQTENLEKRSALLGESIEKGIREKLTAEKSRLEKTIRVRIAEEKSDEIESYRQQLAEKVQEAKSLNKLKAEFERVQREKEEMKQKLEAEMEQKLTQKVASERRKMKEESDSKLQLRVTEKELIINQLKEQLKSAQLKAESGSTQIQGEAQELIIEDYLRESFPQDTIKEVKKGVRGADSIQIINIGGNENCGRIYYESKRTKDFKKTWLDKFKTDMREINANFGVLVTNVLPKDMDRFGQRNGIWICTFEEFKGLCFVLREFVVRMYSASSALEDKGSKMELLYSFLTGNEFRAHLESIVEGFSEMQNDLTKEKRSMEAIWKQREKQIQKVLLNSSQMYGSIKGIAGKSIVTIKALELPPRKK